MRTGAGGDLRQPQRGQINKASKTSLSEKQKHVKCGFFFSHHLPKIDDLKRKYLLDCHSFVKQQILSK